LLVWRPNGGVRTFGVIGARLYHIFSSPQGTNVGWAYYLHNPIEIFMIRKGGLAIYGAVAGGLLAVWLYSRWQKLDFLLWGDIVIPSLFLGQAIGRWGNFFNQEVYGYPTTLPWGIPIDGAYRLPQFQSLPETTRFHPTFAYESLWCLFCFGLTMWLPRRYGDRLLKGDIFLMWGVLYPLGRFFLEMQRPDAWMVGPIAVAQLLAVIATAICLSILIYRHRKARPQG
jgi:phosphatidylglycerol:prolipoprotein diacylglycerol transferase